MYVSENFEFKFSPVKSHLNSLQFVQSHAQFSHLDREITFSTVFKQLIVFLKFLKPARILFESEIRRDPNNKLRRCLH